MITTSFGQNCASAAIASIYTTADSTLVTTASYGFKKVIHSSTASSNESQRAYV